MNSKEFKAGDWITFKNSSIDDKFQLSELEVKYEEVLLADYRFGKEDWVHCECYEHT